MMARRVSKPAGELRLSQVVTTFGPGALLDLPKHSVLVGGLEHWTQGGAEIIEPRLVDKLKRVLQVDTLQLRSPPPELDDRTAPRTGITVWQFPEWFITQQVETNDKHRAVRSRYLVHRKRLTKGKFIDRDRKKRNVVPIRFVRACRRGHIGDIDWYRFVHGDSSKCRRQLWIDERGTTGDLAEVWVRCECGARPRSMSDAARLESKALGMCSGDRPWLGPFTSESCGEPSRLLVRTASNAYFPQKMSVISLPARDEEIQTAVDQAWEHYLQYIETVEELRTERSRKAPVKVALEGFADEEVFAEIQSRKGVGDGKPVKSVKQAEFEALVASKEEVGNDKPDGNFYARALPRVQWDDPLMDPIERVVLVHRLREVVAQVGFTRFESSAPDIQGELEIGVQRADLARELSWLPAYENRGEGVFLGFKKEAIQRWLSRAEVEDRGRSLVEGFDSWKEDHKGSKREFSGLPYLMLHSLSHLLITAVSLECGYPPSSIRERVYANDEGYGILLLTASPDAEGTLGGLVQVGRHIGEHLAAALELGRLCSNDPVCAQHSAANMHERRFLQGAACHGCLLIAETSCEQHNDFLDRALVVQTVENLGTEFFGAAAR